MKTLGFVSAGIIAVMLMGSCVSSKKYNEAMASKANTEQQYQALLDENNNLKAKNDALQNEASRLQNTASSQNVALNEREKALNDEEKKMRDMKALVDEERQAIINLKQEVCSALKCFTPDELSITIRDGKLYVSMADKLLFPSGSDVVNSRGEEAISQLANVLGNSGLEIEIEGHTDSVPIHTLRFKDNWDLSVHRATSVARIFIADGIPPDRIVASGEGKFHAIATNETADGRQQNRRTDIVLAPKLDKLWKLTEEPGTNTSMNKE